MLQTIREHTQGWIAGIVISLIIISFALWGIHSYFVGGSGNEDIVATVNGSEITKEQLSTAYERLRRQAISRLGSASAITSNESVLKSRALQNLVEFEVLRAAAISQGFYVSESQVDSFLQGMSAFQVDGQFSLERFQQVLAANMMNVGQFLSMIKTSLLIDQPRLGVIFTSFALPDEADLAVALINQERSLSYSTIPLTYFLSKPIEISAKQIDAYYQEHQQAFTKPEQVSVSYVELTLDDAAKQIHPTEDELKKFYSENTNAFADPMQWKLIDVLVPVAEEATPEAIDKARKAAEEVANRVKQGGDVATLASQYKQNLSGKSWMTVGLVPIELQEAVGGVTSTGQVAGPIKTSKGFVVVKALDVKQPVPQSFAAAKEKVNAMYVKQRAEEKFAEIKEQLADLTYAQPDSLQSAADTLKLPIQTTDLFSKEQAGTGIAQYQPVRSAAFTDDVKNLQNNSDVIMLDNNRAIVLRLKTHQAAAELPLNIVSADIEKRLKQEVAVRELAQFANELKDKLQSGADLNALSAQYHLSVTSVNEVGRYSQKVAPAILDAAFQLPNPAKLNKQKTYGVAKIANDGYAVIALTSVKDGKITDKKQAAIFAEQVQNSNGILEYELYRQSLMQHAKIKMQNTG